MERQEEIAAKVRMAVAGKADGSEKIS